MRGGDLDETKALRRAGFLRGLREAFGVPAVVLGATFVGFGALVRESGLSVWHGLFSTATGWALPGQIALVELYAVGASLLSIAIAVGLSSVRLLPMTVAVLPLLRDGRSPGWMYYLFAHFVAVTGWAAAMRTCPTLPEAQRFVYFIGFVLVLWTTTLAATGAGYYLAGAVPFSVTLGLVFLNPIYFMLLFAGDVRFRPRVYSLALGGLLGPLTFLATPDWSLLVTGIVGGSLGYGLWRATHGRAAS